MAKPALPIPVSALAISMTSAQLVDPDLLRRAGLGKRQIAAFMIAREFQRRGNREKARNALARAGIDLDMLEEMQRASAVFG